MRSDQLSPPAAATRWRGWPPSSSTSWSSAAASSAPARPSTPSPAGCRSALVEARDYRRGHVQPLQQAHPRRPALPRAARTSAWCARRCTERVAAAATGSRRTWCGRCRSSTRCKHRGLGAPLRRRRASLLYDAMRRPAAAVPAPPPPDAARQALRVAPALEQGRAGRRHPVLRRPGRRRPAHDDARPHRGRTTAPRSPTSAQVVGFLREGERVTGARVRDLETGARVRRSAPGRSSTPPGVWTDDIQEHGRRPRPVPRAGVQGHPPRRAARPDPLRRPGIILRTEKSVLFVIPWGRHWIIGTTDTDWDLDKAHPAASRSRHRLPARPRQLGAARRR